MRIQAYFNNFFWVFLTYLLAPCFYLLIFLKKQKKSQRFKILVIQTAKIGDMVCTTPVFREIKKNFPFCHLTVFCLRKAKGILKNNPRVNEILLVEDYPGVWGKIRLLRKLRKEKYDWAINLLPGSFNNIIAFWSLVPNRVATTHRYSGEIIKLLSIFNNYLLEYKRHTYLPGHYLTLLKFMGIEDCSQGKEIFIKPEEEKKASNFLGKNNLNDNSLLIGIAPACGAKLKEWPLENYAKFADRLVERLKAKVIFIGASADGATVEKIQKIMKNNSVNSCGLFELHELPALLKKLKLLISGDTGPLYIADAAGIFLVYIAGPSDIREQSPLHGRCRIIRKNLYCSPCLYSTSSLRYCGEGHLRCLKDITPEEVFKAAVSLIGPANRSRF